MKFKNPDYVQEKSYQELVNEKVNELLDENIKLNSEITQLKSNLDGIAWRAKWMLNNNLC